MKDQVEIRVGDQYRSRRKGVLKNERIVPNFRARFATNIMERFALVSAKENGEDSAGRQKLCRFPAKEMAVFACDVAEAAFQEYERRGWLAEGPSLDELEDGEE